MAAACRFATVGKHMASAPSRKDSLPFSVLESYVDMSEFTGEPEGEGWSRIECASKKAYGCGDLGQALVESLRLYVRFSAYPVVTSSLAIRTSDDEVVRRIGAELGVPKDKQLGGRMEAWGTVHVADRCLVAIRLVFRQGYSPDLLCYLVYDGIDSSLSLIKGLPDDHEVCCTLTPALNRVGYRGGDFELAVLGRKRKLLSPRNMGVLCICTLDSRANPSVDALGPWKVKHRFFPKEVGEPLLADRVFTFQDKAFWADFRQGCLLYCDLHTCGDNVEFSSISLPAKCVPDPEGTGEDDPGKVIRNIGCAGDSIRLVYIHRTRSCADDLLMIWTLDLAKKQWEQELELPAKLIWKLYGFKKAGLPRTSFIYPDLTPEGDLCLLMQEEIEDTDEDTYDVVPVKYHICFIDVHSWKLLWHGHVHDYHAISPVILPPNLFAAEHLSDIQG